MSSHELSLAGARLLAALACGGVALLAGAAHSQARSQLAAAAPPAPPAPPAVRAASMPASTALPVPAMAATGTAAEIQKINEQMALLQAQLNQLELQAKIAARKKEIQAAATLPEPPAPGAFDSRLGLPAVVSVAGLKGQLQAVLALPGGLTQRVKAGDLLGARRVQRVALDEVVLTDLEGRQPQRLAFGSAALVRENPAPGNPLPAGGSPALPAAFPSR